MRRLLLLGLASVVALTALLAPPAHSTTLCCDNSDLSTSVHKGTGSTCALAEANMRSLCTAEANKTCLHGACVFAINYVDQCFANPGGGSASTGFADFDCLARCIP